MTREQAKHLAEVLNAYAEGKTIEVLLDGKWGEVDLNEYSFDENESYRIKKEPKYRPFKNAKECFEEMKKHYPIGWMCLNKIWDNIFVHITKIGARDIEFVRDIEFDSCVYSFVEAFNKGFTFADGQPFGIKE